MSVNFEKGLLPLSILSKVNIYYHKLAIIDQSSALLMRQNEKKCDVRCVFDSVVATVNIFF